MARAEPLARFCHEWAAPDLGAALSSPTRDQACDQACDAIEAPAQVGACVIDETLPVVAVEGHGDRGDQPPHPVHQRTAAFVIKVDAAADALRARTRIAVFGDER